MRGKKKIKKICRVRKKYQNINIQDNRRFLLSILAVRGLDDSNYPNFKPSGSLSVNEYGQVNIFKLNHCGITTFAHPTEAVVDTLLDCADIGGKLIGIENNAKNKYNEFDRFLDVKNKMSLIELKGSDCHFYKENMYDDLSKYEIEDIDLKKYIKIVEKMII